MGQTGIIFAALGIAFLVYITAKGELKTWLSIFGI
jgi:hypothetical protein